MAASIVAPKMGGGGGGSGSVNASPAAIAVVMINNLVGAGIVSLPWTMMEVCLRGAGALARDEQPVAVFFILFSFTDERLRRSRLPLLLRRARRVLRYCARPVLRPRGCLHVQGRRGEGVRSARGDRRAEHAGAIDVGCGGLRMCVWCVWLRMRVLLCGAASTAAAACPLARGALRVCMPFVFVYCTHPRRSRSSTRCSIVAALLCRAGTCVSYVVLIGDLWPEVLGGFGAGGLLVNRTFLICVVAGCALFPLSLVRDLSALRCVCVCVGGGGLIMPSVLFVREEQGDR